MWTVPSHDCPRIVYSCGLEAKVGCSRTVGAGDERMVKGKKPFRIGCARVIADHPPGIVDSNRRIKKIVRRLRARTYPGHANSIGAGHKRMSLALGRF